MPDKLLEEDIRDRLQKRVVLLANYQSLDQEAKNNLQKELQADHQKVLLEETQSPDENEKEKWRQLRLEIEAQNQEMMSEEKVVYQKLVKPLLPKQTVVKNTIIAFVVGGLICVIGQAITNTVISLGLGTKEAGTVTSAILVFSGALLTGLGIYDEIGRFAGAGSIVPITGFANSIVSSALEFKREGYVYGVGAHLFTIAGPVLVYGTVISVFIGVIYYLLR